MTRRDLVLLTEAANAAAAAAAAYAAAESSAALIALLTGLIAEHQRLTGHAPAPEVEQT